MGLGTNCLLRSAAHAFYTRLNEIFDKLDFEGYVEGLCSDLPDGDAEISAVNKGLTRFRSARILSQIMSDRAR
jgi:hypothetical protein